MHFPVRRALSLLMVLTVASSAYVGKWHSFTNKNLTTSLIAYQGYVYAGTQGGIRRISPSNLEEKDYDNLDGLLDCSIVGLAKSADSNGDSTLWAISHSGFVYSLSGDQWNIYGRSYAAQQWSMSDRAVVAAGHYLYLGSVMGLTIFDLNQKVSQANITRFANLSGDSVLSVLRQGDTLYVGTPQGVYKAGIDFSNPLNPDTTYGNLSDPSIWTLVPLSPTLASGAPRQYNFLTFVDDSLETFGPGMMLQQPVQVNAFTGSPAVIGSTSFPSVTELTSALALSSEVFLGSLNGLFVSPNPLSSTPTLSTIPSPAGVPSDTLWNVAANNNDLWAQSSNGLYGLNASSGDTTLFVPFYTESGTRVISSEFLYRHLMNLKAATNGDVYVGSWGGGLVRVRNGQKQVWNGTTDPCIIEVIPGYPVVYGLSNVSQYGVYFAMLEPSTNQQYSQLDYVDTSGHVTCIDSLVPGIEAHAVQVFADSFVGVGSDAGVTFYKIRKGAGAPQLSSLGLWGSNGSANETWSLTTDNLGRPWGLVGNQLAYVDTSTLDSAFNYPGSVSKTFIIPGGFSGTDCFSLESDPLGSLWVGCTNGLFYVKPGASGIAQSQGFGLDDGLLSLNISDISVDPSNGRVWVATDLGLSMLESASQPPVANLQTVRAYPNPFLPQHRFVVFDNLPLDATVRIHNAAGSVVRIFHPTDLVGNQALWDGTNQEGQPLPSAGIYLYSVTSGSSVQRGKIIVAR